MRVALLGGTGFVGTRLVERWLLGGGHDLHLVVRGPGSLARVARFQLPSWAACDIFDAQALAQSIRGCDAMVHAVVGDPDQIVIAARAALQACRLAGVKRLVYLSSASVHGQNPAPGTDDFTALRDDQPIEYNNAKVLAERALAGSTDVEVVILRPGIVYGPRSQWFTDLPRALRSGRAFLVDGGNGWCNHIYVDNLIQAIELGLVHPQATDKPFYVSDSTCLTWREFYRPVVEALGFGLDDMQNVAPAARPSRSVVGRHSARVKNSGAARMVLPLFSRRLKDAVKAGLQRYSAPEALNGFAIPRAGAPMPDWEISELHTCKTRLPMDRAVSLLGYAPEVDADEALARSARWLSGLWD
ncbi:NAD(P)H-binding protein [Variovorax dokdonensis]|uniref:NAD(P)H-binding protein n=1 Tax=Variovorax dokdonensis TaxID=344883 RepID=A0ABT7N5Q1_9BURK|nr:NAD-dependent epimerase/dehydratase family protein [Variovorax dokdonensis]MDM0043232.1 NAD(P)H-binding protein [Variovorax dokdonensis]